MKRVAKSKRGATSKRPAAPKKPVSKRKKVIPPPPESCILPVRVLDMWRFHRKYSDAICSAGKQDLFNKLFKFKMSSPPQEELKEAVFHLLLSEDYKGLKMLIDEGVEMPPLFEGLDPNSEVYYNIYIRHPGKHELMNLLYLFPKGKPNGKSSWNMDTVYNNPNYKLPDSLKGLSSDQKELISSNTGIVVDYARTHMNELDWNLLSANPAFTIKDIENNPDLPWKKRWLSQNPNMSLKYVLSHPDTKDGQIGASEENEDILLDMWDLDELSRNEGISIEEIEATPQIRWRKGALLQHPGVTRKFVEKFKLISNSWVEMGKVFETTKDYVKELRLFSTKEDFENVTDEFSSNVNIPFSFINANPQYKWNYSLVWSRPNVTVDDVEKYIHTACDHDSYSGEHQISAAISRNAGVPLWYIQQHPKFGWSWFSDMYDTDADELELDEDERHWGNVSENPNMTVGFVLAHLDEIEFGGNGLSGNLFGRDKQVAAAIERDRKAVMGEMRQKEYLGARTGVRGVTDVVEEYYN